MFLNKSKSRIEQLYQKRILELPDYMAALHKKIEKLAPDTALAIQYLYCTMPLSDIANYSFETYLDYANHGVFLWKTSETVRGLPEEMFLNYILYHRINEEEITPCRSYFYQLLKDRLIGIKPEEAALAVNYWCAEEATYQTTDDRTLSPMAVYQRGNGRCGEESTFTISALRSVGIPARQIYAPCWSHCDDNHAWVEAWCDGTWGFMGACEPEPILNKGWFTNASSRAMMIHSRWFDSSVPDGAAIGQSGMVTMVNQLPRYAKTAELTVLVESPNGTPIHGAQVLFEVLNYACFSPIAETMTASDGIARLTTGLGSLCIHVSKDGMHADMLLNTKEETSCRILLPPTANTMDAEERSDCWLAFDMTAPKDAPIHAKMPTTKQQADGNAKVLAATEKRRRKVEALNFPERDLFLAAEKPDGRLRKALLDTLTAKDQTDCRCEVLEEHLQYALPYHRHLEEELFIPYVMNPRIDHEVLTPYRETIEDTFSIHEKERFRKKPVRIWEMIKASIRECPQMERSSLITTPAALLKLKIGSDLSKRVLFVAIARTLGIPARLNPEDREAEYHDGSQFVRLTASAEKTCTLVLDGEDVNWTYYQNWSIGKLKDNDFVTLHLSGQKWEDRHLTLTLEPGTYRLLTVNRLPNGNLFANRYLCTLTEGSTKAVTLSMRHAELSEMLENNALPAFTLTQEDGSSIEGEALLKDSSNIMLWLEESKEPTEHILNELLERQEEFRRYSGQICFVLRSPEALRDPTIAKARDTFPEIRVCYDDFTQNVELLGRRMYVDFEKLPLILVTHGKMNGVYAASGYNVGTGDMLLRLLQ